MAAPHTWHHSPTCFCLLFDTRLDMIGYTTAFHWCDGDMNSNNESKTEVESKSDTENQELLETINDITSTFNNSLLLRKKFRKK